MTKIEALNLGGFFSDVPADRLEICKSIVLYVWDKIEDNDKELSAAIVSVIMKIYEKRTFTSFNEVDDFINNLKRLYANIDFEEIRRLDYSNVVDLDVEAEWLSDYAKKYQK